MKQQEVASPESKQPHEDQTSIESIPDSDHLPLTELQVLTGTIRADITSNKKFMHTHFKVTIGLLLVILFLKLLPSPLIIRTFQNEPTALAKENCSNDEDCEEVQEGYEGITIKKVNPLQRQLKYFVRLNQDKMKQLEGLIDNHNIDLNHEITWIEIYAIRNNGIYGNVIYEKSGDEAYEIIFNNKALIYIGEVHILSEASYLIRIYKRIYNQTIPQTDNSTNITETVREVSVPLSVELVRYSQFYTGAELLIRYVSFLFILYVRAETLGCPLLFQAILFFTANPLIFTEIAFPNTASNMVSSMCSNAYIFYIPIFLYYTHRRLPNPRADLGLKILKLFASLGLYMASIIRSLHLMNQTLVEWVQYLLIVAIMIPILKYLWRMYFVRSMVVLHRNMLFVVLTIYYFAILFFSGYLVDYGWKKISFYLIVQVYGVSLCYLTAPKALVRQTPPAENSPNAKTSLTIRSNASNNLESEVKNQLSDSDEIEEHFVNIM